jgi:hypothetical protein
MSETMTPYDEINLWIATLTEAWGAVEINCDGYVCVVSDEAGLEKYEAATLMEALRLAVAEVEVEP